MIGEGAVGLAVLLDGIEAQAADELRADDAETAVAAVEHHLERTLDPDDARYVVHVIGLDVAFFRLAAARFEIVVVDQRFQLLDALPVQAVFFETDLEAVELRRIVTAGDHDAAVRVEVVQREVGHRRRHHADVDDIATGAVQGACHDGTELLRAFSNVPAQSQRFFAVTPEISADGFADLFDVVGRQVLCHQAPDVVFAEDLRIHGLSGLGCLLY